MEQGFFDLAPTQCPPFTSEVRQYPAEKFCLLLRCHLHLSSANTLCQFSHPISWLHLPLSEQSFPTEVPSGNVSRLCCLGSGVSQPLWPIYQNSGYSQTQVKASQIFLAFDECCNYVHQKWKDRPQQLSENVKMRKALLQYQSYAKQSSLQ